MRVAALLIALLLSPLGPVARAGSNPTPQYSGQLIVNHIEDYGFLRYEMGYAAAVSVVLLVMVVKAVTLEPWRPAPASPTPPPPPVVKALTARQMPRHGQHQQRLEGPTGRHSYSFRCVVGQVERAMSPGECLAAAP